jgi:UDP-GlcNAc3NAcA epimerase
MIKVLTIVGARPQFVKAAAVSRAFSKYEINEVLVHTGQHFDDNMSKVFFDEMGIPTPKYNLDIHGLGHGAMTGRMLEKIEEVIVAEKPNIVMVYGDTNSTLAGALAARKLNVKIAHVEAGLRSFNMTMPEEINRILTDRISDVLFCPTDAAINNLAKEGFNNFNIQIIKNGDVMQDAAIFYSKVSAQKSTIINNLKLQPGKFVLCTIHRQENTDNLDNLKEILSALNQINAETKIVLPLHPRTKNILAKENIKLEFETIDPVGYFDMIELLKNCSLVMTDSGGVQKEAFFFQKHCITLRDETEWIELVSKGFNAITGAKKDTILSEYTRMLNKQSDFNIDLYGNGKASEVIAKKLVEMLG